MRVAVDGVYFGGGRAAEEFVALAAESGADAVNWPLRPGYADPGDPDSWEQCAALLGEAALDVVSLAASGQNSALAGEGAAFHAEITQGVKAAQVLDCDLVDCWPRMGEGATKPDSQRILRANIEAVADLLVTNGMVISFEFEPDTTIERYAEALEFLAPLPTVARLTADTYHINRAGDDLVASAKAMAGRFGILHISGSHRGEPGSEGDTCDHEGFVRAAREVGYVGDLVLQYAPPPDTLDSLKRAVALCQRIIERTG
ncbi:MAG: sugar phosphate isomerase/epimerase [Armatimonadetes bacterium]|nr:sugar phosphate isomerase/epimerase [Armatimonadota bacterium]